MTAAQIVEQYLSRVGDIHATGAGTAETSYYGALETLFNELGQKLKPKVRSIIQLSNSGAGVPDGGLFTKDQFQRAADLEPRPGQIPSRGAIEVKGPGDEIAALIKTEQVAKYVKKYRQVLLTNLREFLLVTADAKGKPKPLEGYSLAASEAGFWSLCAKPRKAAEQHGERLTEFLTRAMLHAAPLADPKDLAWFLASYAREARARLEMAALDPLPSIRAALEEALGIRFTGDKGEHFFRSTFIQTLFYGVFSAWVLWDKENSRTDKSARFRWKETADYIHVPFLRALYYQLANPGPLKDLGLTEVLEWAERVLNRVDRASFFTAFEEGHAVQYFYEPFLEAFDPALRKELGVWYTPHEVVQYMVARVDTVLKEELGIADGLADKQVFVLDPCCGTGAYLVEVLKHIAATLRDKGGDALLAQDLKKAALERIIGFEILTAPFVVSHLQLGLLLSSLGAPLKDDESERVGVYLTNALTGWEPPTGPKASLPFKEFEAERDAADAVKRERPILVVLGNPPYNGYAGVAVDEERELTTAYKTTKKAPPPEGQGLNDLYVRFYRMAERRIVDMTGKGVVCFISNYSWLDGLSFTGMRERYLDEFDRIWVDCLNGDKYKTGKLTPEGNPDPSVFSTKSNREGIQVGTAIALLVKKKPHQKGVKVLFRHLWGREKRTKLLESATSPEYGKKAILRPSLEMGLPLIPSDAAGEYLSWPSLVDLFPKHYSGVTPGRSEALISIDREPLIERMEQYFDESIDNQRIASLHPALMKQTKTFAALRTRKILIKTGFSPDSIICYCFRPFDNRWLYWEAKSGLLDRAREDFLNDIFTDNLFIEARKKQPKDNFDRGYVTGYLGDDFGNGRSSFFPLLTKEYKASDSPNYDFYAGDTDTKYNISTPSRDYLQTLNTPPDDLFYHAITILHSPTYRKINASVLRLNWPRIPLPASKDRLVSSADLGRKVASLLDPTQKAPGVTTGNIRPELKLVTLISREGGGMLSGDDLELTAGWGYSGQGGATMPGRGRAIERDYTAQELEAIGQGAAALGLDAEQALELLGRTTLDVYLNDRAYWRNVPHNVWAYTIGGYQVIKKWLSYRERPLLGRDLTTDEARYVTEVARRIAAILLMGPELDANYEAVKANSYAWPS